MASRSADHPSSDPFPFFASNTRYRFTWTTGEETGEKVRLQYSKERRPDSYDREQEPDEAVELLSDNKFSIGTLSENSETWHNGQGFSSDAEDISESNDSDDVGIADATWLGDESEYDIDKTSENDFGGSAFRMVSSNSTDACKANGQFAPKEQSRGDSGVCVSSEDEKSDVEVGVGRGENLAALTNLREKLHTAVKRQIEEDGTTRIMLMQNRVMAMENLKVPLPEAESKRETTPAGKNSQESLNTSALHEKDSKAIERKSSGYPPGDNATLSPLSMATRSPANDRKSRTMRQKNTETSGKRRSRLLTAQSSSLRAGKEDGDGNGTDPKQGASPQSSTQQPKSRFRDIASMNKLLERRSGNMREYRTVPGEGNGQDAGVADEKAAKRAALIHGMGNGEPRESGATPRSSRAPSKRRSLASGQGIIDGDSPAKGYRPPASSRQPVSIRRSISNVMGLGGQGSENVGSRRTKDMAPVSLRRLTSLKAPAPMRVRRKQQETMPTSPISPSSPPKTGRKKTPVRPSAPIE